MKGQVIKKIFDDLHCLFQNEAEIEQMTISSHTIKQETTLYRLVKIFKCMEFHYF